MERSIRTVGIIGAGVMGQGIAALVAGKAYSVILYDQNQDQCSSAVAAIENRLRKRAKQSALEIEAIISRICIADSLYCFSHAEVVIEAIIENLELKQSVFAQLEAICSEDCILASNTSTISISALSSNLRLPQRLIGIHFFNPAPVMRLVEIISGLSTSPDILERSKEWVGSLGKETVLCRSTPGFIVNRISRPFYVEAFAIKQDLAIDFSVVDGLLVSSGQFRMGPFELIDLIGVETNYRNTYSLFESFYYDKRYQPSFLHKEYAEAGRLGQKTGQGFYEYHAGEKKNALQRLEEHLGTLGKNNHGREHNDNQALKDRTASKHKLLDNLQTLAPLGPITEFHGQEAFLLEGVFCFICSGKTARQVAHEIGENVCLLDWSTDYKKTPYLGVSYCLEKKSAPPANEFLLALERKFAITPVVLPDQPGLLVARMLSALVNEACDAVVQQVCTQKDADDAVCYGLNYTKGLFALFEYIGWESIKGVLEGMMEFYQCERYRTSILIKQCAYE